MLFTEQRCRLYSLSKLKFERLQNGFGELSLCTWTKKLEGKEFLPDKIRHWQFPSMEKAKGWDLGAKKLI